MENAATAIFQTESAAKAALDTARHRYGLIIEPPQPTTPFVGPPIPPLEAGASSEEKTASDKLEVPPEVKEFQLDIWPSDFVHEKYIKSPLTNPLHGPFQPASPDNSFIGAALKQSVPPSPWATGLMDWETDGVRRRGFAGLNVDPEGEDASGANVDQASFLRRLGRRQMKAPPKVMLGLRALKEERRQKEEQERQLREQVERQTAEAPELRSNDP